MKVEKCLVLILGGGKGVRLFPLTLERSKPAIGFAGKYRLIDVPVSNCINSGFNKIFVLTQFLSASLHSHLMHTYHFDKFSNGFVEILSAEQSHKDFGWFQGTADAVRRVLRHLQNMPQENVLILSGDHIYKMDYRDLLSFHLKRGADATVASVLVDEAEASRMGILDVAASSRIKKIIEKPVTVSRLKVKSKVNRSGPRTQKQYVASMGIYLFKKSVLFDILAKSKSADFARYILPLLIKNKQNVYAYDFKSYWRDIGTIKSYYEASMDMIAKSAKFDFFDEQWPLFSRARFLPPSKIIDSHLSGALIGEGCQIQRANIETSIIGLRSKIMDKTKIKNSIIMGNDYYQRKFGREIISHYIGQGVIIERAIVDKNVTIGNFCHITDKSNSRDFDGEFYFIRDGITIIRRGAVLKPHTII